MQNHYLTVEGQDTKNGWIPKINFPFHLKSFPNMTSEIIAWFSLNRKTLNFSFTLQGLRGFNVCVPPSWAQSAQEYLL